MGTELKQCRERLMEEYGATSLDRTTELELEPSMDGSKEREKRGSSVTPLHLSTRLQN